MNADYPHQIGSLEELEKQGVDPKRLIPLEETEAKALKAMPPKDRSQWIERSDALARLLGRGARR